MIKINIKPLSVNACWQGRRYKNALYKIYEKQVLSMLPYTIDKITPPLCVYYEFGFSNMNSDLDNSIKPFQDLLQKKYNFNDREIYKILAIKNIVKKGDEYIKFSISQLE